MSVQIQFPCTAAFRNDTNTSSVLYQSLYSLCQNEVSTTFGGIGICWEQFVQSLYNALEVLMSMTLHNISVAVQRWVHLCLSAMYSIGSYYITYLCDWTLISLIPFVYWLEETQLLRIDQWQILSTFNMYKTYGCWSKFKNNPATRKFSNWMLS